MIPSDSAQRPTISLSPRLQPWGRVLALLIDMLAVGCLTLFYDGLIGAVVLWIEAIHYSKSSTHIFKATGLALGAGLAVGGLAVIGLLLSKMYLRALAVLLGLLPLVLVTQLVYKIL